MANKFHAKKIGITGGIGSGKTTICKLFEKLGISVYYADIEARALMNYNPALKLEIKRAFGEDIYDSNSMLDRDKLSKIVFNKGDELEKLNRLVHPAVEKDFESFANAHKNDDFILYESALLIDTGNYKKMDAVILVIADLETRIQRVIQRDHCTREEVILRISRQFTDEEKKPLCNYIIENKDGADLNTIVEDLHFKILTN